MPRALLLASLLAVPALAAAQVPVAGQVLFANGRDFPNYVNAFECNAANNAVVTVRWTPTFLTPGATSLPGGGVYQIYASNLDPTTNAASGAGGNTCFTSTITTGNQPVTAGQIIDAQGNNPILAPTAVIRLSDFVTAAGQSGCPNEGVQVWICVQGFSGSTKVAFASASVIISTTTPPPPTITSVTPGDGALNVSWDAGFAFSSFTGDSYSYQLEAVMIGTTIPGITDPNAHTSNMFTQTSARFGGLVNSVTYNVTARTFSKAGNPSSFSAPVPGTPQAVLDFYDTYKNAPYHGRDVGCGSGLAGPLALALVAGALALARRRR
jgi:hypothetical protein